MGTSTHQVRRGMNPMRISHPVRQFLSVAIVISMAGTIASGQWFKDGERLPNQPWSKSEGNFGAMLLLSDTPEEFLTAWTRRTPGVSIRPVNTIRRGVTLAPWIILNGGAPN